MRAHEAGGGGGSQPAARACSRQQVPEPKLKGEKKSFALLMIPRASSPSILGAKIKASNIATCFWSFLSKITVAKTKPQSNLDWDYHNKSPAKSQEE